MTTATDPQGSMAGGEVHEGMPFLTRSAWKGTWPLIVGSIAGLGLIAAISFGPSNRTVHTGSNTAYVNPPVPAFHQP
ncbi:MAG TPA: hypothetical protein VFH45_13260 [Acidimicrobiales bacterium]|nr:hypothetical protein [Acidimicrobiales bacterium]